MTMGDMVEAAAPPSDISSRPELSAKISALGMNVKRMSTVDDDSSSMSSPAPEIFDRTQSNATGQWAIEADGTWRRYGSSESATSTGISSICSSIINDDKTSDQSSQTPFSKKRTSDGTLKHLSLKLGARPDTVSTPTQPSQPSPQVGSQNSQSTPAKRRGRPPKDKSAAKSFPGSVRRASMISKLQDRVRPRSSLPTNVPKDVFASECIEAAHNSRLSPYALHSGEHQLLANQLMSAEVTIYLNIRNAILRLWQNNPLCVITVEEAAGCAKEGRFFGLAEVAYKWLVRNGYINFGCVEVPREAISSKKHTKQRTVVVVGAGVSGLTTARQLEHLFAQNSSQWTDWGERPPRVIVLEGRKRIGGRVYSKALRSQVPGSLPGDLRNTAEMGAMIVTGFDHGNPLSTIIRGQLGLPYHLMTDELTLYDTDGQAVDEETDKLNTDLYADISERAGEFRAEPQQQVTLKGDQELIDRARDPVASGFENFELEPLFPVDNVKHRKPVTRRGRRRNAPPGTEKLTGRSRVIEESDATQSAAKAAKTMGRELKDGVARNQSISLHKIAKSSHHPTLGAVMDNAIEQYKSLMDLTPQDMRLLNWHHANLEYANAAPVSSLSLSGHDQDTGNEFEGAHSEIIGGYTQVPRGLMNLPTPLDVRFGRNVESIHYNESGDPAFGLTTKVVCTDGEVFEADEVVMTAPLGVLKSDTVDFDPPLPGWKQGAIDRMGFGLLNKLILLYDEPFWDDDRDMFGLLNEAEIRDSLHPVDYAKKRGRFYLIWNASKISGRPMLVALMAGHSAHEAENTDTTTLLGDISNRLRKTFPEARIPAPLEVIVTRWKQDPFTRGTYSYVAPETRPGDYDLMALPVGNLHFAGEATCGTHPATVHGAFLSGLRVAADVMGSMVGPITLPEPLVLPSPIKPELTSRYSLGDQAMLPTLNSTSGGKLGSIAGFRPGEPMVEASAPVIKQEQDNMTLADVPPVQAGYAVKKPNGPPSQSVCAGDESFWVRPAAFDSANLDHEAMIVGTILAQIGERPVKPTRPGVNPFLLFTKEKWEACKATCDPTSGKDVVRQTLGQWWRAAPPQVKAPYQAQGAAAQQLADAARMEYETKAKKWDEDAKRIRKEYLANNPVQFTAGVGGQAAVGVSKRKTNVSNCIVLDHA